MSRDSIRAVKRLLRHGMDAQAAEGPRRLAEAAALALLERSVRMRHRRLAVQRLNDAMALGVQVPDEHWFYCRLASVACRDAAVQALFAQSEQAVRAASGRSQPASREAGIMGIRLGPDAACYDERESDE